MNWADVWDAMFGGLPYYGQILELVWNSVVAGAVLGLVGGLIGVYRGSLGESDITHLPKFLIPFVETLVD